MAGASIVAAIGTVSAVVLSLWLALDRSKRRVDVQVRLAWLSDERFGLYAFYLGLEAKAIGCSDRPTTITSAHICGLDGVRYRVDCRDNSDSLPATLSDGSVLTVNWEWEGLGHLTTQSVDAPQPAYVLFSASTGETFRAPLARYRVKRYGLLWRRQRIELRRRRQTRRITPADQMPPPPGSGN